MNKFVWQSLDALLSIWLDRAQRTNFAKTFKEPFH